MSNQDQVFIKVGIVDNKPDALAVARLDRKGQGVASYSGTVDVNNSFADLITAMRREIIVGRAAEYVVIAHYPEIERELLRKHYQQTAGSAEVFAGRLWLSASQLLWPLVDSGMIPSTQFETVCPYFGITRAERSTAEDDCADLGRMYIELMRRYRSSLIVEEGVRDFAGPTIDKFRKMVGI